ncbi:DUF1173 family protein [Nocardia salmonicida]|uniref:DUF1173 family protein n=1 Tax=Nocardia salmonicida TaxID=53431 RepID=UPI0037959AE0
MHDDWVDWVRLSGRKFPLDDVRADPDNYARALAAARTEKSAECLCRPTPLQLVTRATQSGRHHLACWPGTGPKHRPQCAFHRLDPETSGASAYTDSAIREAADGTSIRFAAPLVSNPSETTRAAVDQNAYPGVGRRSMGLLGLVHHLWEASRLTAWSAGSRARTWADVARAVEQYAQTLTISRQPAERCLFTVPAYRRELAAANLAAFDTFVATLQADRKQIRRGFVLGEIKSIDEGQYGLRYQLAHQSRQRQIFVNAELDSRLRSSYRPAFAQAGEDAGGRKVGLFYVERSRNGFTIAVDAAVMLTNSAYIPSDSSFEVRMADALHAAGRSFIKPVTYDAASDAVFPDYVLTDTTAPTYVEVWGLPGREDYERRKAEKIAHYQRAAATLIEWNVGNPMPNLRHTGGGYRDRLSAS